MYKLSFPLNVDIDTAPMPKTPSMEVCGAFIGRDKNGKALYCTRLSKGWCKRHAIDRPSRKGSLNRPENMYTQILDESERDLYLSQEIGKLDHEIRLLRVKLMRDLKRQQHVEVTGTPDHTDGRIIRRTDADGNVSVERELRPVDYEERIHKTMALLEKMERSHKDLLQTSSNDGRIIILGGLPIEQAPQAPQAPQAIEHDTNDHTTATDADRDHITHATF